VTPNRAVLLYVLVFVLVVPVAAGSVARTVMPLPEGSGSDFEVTLTVTGIPIGGIVETIPDGCTWAGCDHPENSTRVSGEKVAFAVIGEDTIRYRVQGPSEAGEAFTGTWEDLLADTSGIVGAGEPRSPGPETTTAPSTSGFGCAVALAALAAGYRWRCGR
jgi:hypothetical protein